MSFALDSSMHSVRVLLAALMLAGCQVYDPALVSNDGLCEGRRPPARPDVVDGADGDDIVIGLGEVVLDQEEDALFSRLGYNLDGFCTDAPDFHQACERDQSGGRPTSDGVDGIDNVFGSDLFPLVKAVVPGLQETSRAHQRAGGGLVVLRIRGWSGEPDDPRVHVTITQSVDSVPSGADDPPPELSFIDYDAYLPSGEPAPSPVLDGNDYTFVRADTFIAGNVDEPIVFDNNAYVADDVLVAKLPDRVELHFQGDGVGVVARLVGGVVTGTFTDDRMGLEDVVVAGRWTMVDLLRTAEHVGVCQGTAEYNLLRSRLEAFLDVSSTTDLEPETPCDAISIGVGFTGYRMRLGGTVEGPTVLNRCEVPLDGGVPDGGMPASGGADGAMSDPDAGTRHATLRDAGP